MPALHYYPYKYMPLIVKSISSKGSSLRNIRSVSGACLTDSIEILQMLTYITSLGRVNEVNEKYFIQKNSIPTSSPSPPRRKFLISELESLLNILTGYPQSVENLLEKIEWTDSKDELENYLKFLIEITNKGQIQGGISFLGIILQRGNWVIV